MGALRMAGVAAPATWRPPRRSTEEATFQEGYPQARRTPSPPRYRERGTFSKCATPEVDLPGFNQESHRRPLHGARDIPGGKSDTSQEAPAPRGRRWGRPGGGDAPLWAASACPGTSRLRSGCVCGCAGGRVRPRHARHPHREHRLQLDRTGAGRRDLRAAVDGRRVRAGVRVTSVVRREPLGLRRGSARGGGRDRPAAVLAAVLSALRIGATERPMAG